MISINRKSLQDPILNTNFQFILHFLGILIGCAKIFNQSECFKMNEAKF